MKKKSIHERLREGLELTSFVVVRAEKKRGEYASFTQRIRGTGPMSARRNAAIALRASLSQGEKPSQFTISVYHFPDADSSAEFYDALDGNRVSAGDIDKLLVKIRETIPEITESANMRRDPRAN